MQIMKTKTAKELDIDRLYHYQSFKPLVRLAYIFTGKGLYFSRPRDFNDPWDCRPCFSKSGLDDHDEYEHTVQWFARLGRSHNTTLSEEEHLRNEQELRTNRKFLERMIDEVTNEMVDAIQDQYRVYSLSTHPDSTLMWSHYADSCRGICLEFSVHNELFCGALPVEYHDSYQLFSVIATDGDANIRPLLTKSSDWNYEDEFRLIASAPPSVFPNVLTTKNGFLPIPAGALQSVIMGANMPSADRGVVRRLVKKSEWNVALKVANLVPDRYKFEIEIVE